MNNMQVQETNVNKKPQTESASSKTVLSLLQLSSLDKEESRLNDSLFKNKLIIIGNIITATAIIAIIPQDFFINERLALTVLSASLTEAPTNGTKLLIANLAVFKEMESALCERVFL